MPDSLRIVIFCHSLLSDWNHGNAHFLRGVAWELKLRGHRVDVYEPEGNWSLTNLLQDRGPGAVDEFTRVYPGLASTSYRIEDLNLDLALSGADLVIVHEWSQHELVARIGSHREAKGGYRLLFHDTHHRSVSDPAAMESYDLQHYDGVLAFGEVIRDRYLSRKWARKAWTWHEAADARVFRPLDLEKTGDLVWIGNWGDEERTAELHEFLLKPSKDLGLKTHVYGVRYPSEAIEALRASGITHGGSIANYSAPEVFGRHKVTVHVPRRPYVEALPGIPTIRVFEALACGIPLISAHWDDCEGLFTPGEDFLVAKDGSEMKTQLQRVLSDPKVAESLAERGRATVLARHTCSHRVDQLLEIYESLNQPERAFVGAR